MEKEQVKKGQAEAKSESDEVGKLFRDITNSKPLYPDNETALAAYRKKLDDLAVLHGKSAEAYLEEALATSNRTREHMDAIQFARSIQFLSQRK